MDAAYLQSTVGPLLSTAVTATLQQQPLDPVSFLAHFLLQQHSAARLQPVLAAQAAALAQRDEADHATAAAAAAARDAEAAALVQQTAEREAALSSFLASHPSRDSLLPTLYPLLSAVVPVPGMYVARAEVTEAGGSLDTLKFISANAANAAVLTRRTTRPDGVLFDLLTADEEAEAEAEDGAEAGARERSYRALFIPNVLLGEKGARVRFFQAPRPGSLFALRVDVPSVLSEESMEDVLERIREREERCKEEAEERKRKAEEQADAAEDAPADDAEEEEVDEDDADAVAARDQRRAARAAAQAAIKEETAEEKAQRESREARQKEEKDEADLVAAVVKKVTPLLFVFDTLGLGRAMGDDERAAIERTVRGVEKAMVRLDVASFIGERTAYGAFVAWHNARVAAASDAEAAADDSKAEREAVKKERKAAGLPHTPQDVDLVVATRRLLAVREGVALLRETEVLRGGCAEAYGAAVVAAGVEAGKGDWEGRVEWAGLRALMDDAWWGRVEGLEVRGDEDEGKWAAVRAMVARVKGEEEGRLGERNAVGKAVVEWVRAVLAVRARVKRERKEEKEKREREERERKEKEEEEARKRQEEEDAAKEAAGGDDAGGEEEEADS